VIAGLLALTVIAISAAGIAVHNAANASRQAANASRQHAIALSRQLATESLAADATNPLTARRLAVAAWRVFPTDQVGSVLASLLMEQLQAGILPGDPANGGVAKVAFSRAGNLLAAAYGDGTVRLWNPVTGQLVGASFLASSSPQSYVLGVAFGPDGKLLATADADGMVRIWQMALFADPYVALCADVGPPTQADWRQYAPVNHSPASADDNCPFPPARA
jgi:WD domain, G-beta repeat